MDKRQLLSTITDPAIREVSARFLDLIDKCEKTHETQFTYFLSPEMADACEQLWIRSKSGLRMERFGGYEDAEYVVIGLCQPYDHLEPAEFPIAAIRAVVTSKTFEVTHRDVLGSLMGVGIMRNRTGDLLISGDHIQMLIYKEMASVVLGQLDKISRYSVRLESMELDALVLPEPEGELLFKTVSSLRIDAVLAAGFNLSRGQATELIKSEKVKVDHKIVSDTSRQISETALISCRGKGRLKLMGSDGISKKDRIKLKLLRMG